MKLMKSMRREDIEKANAFGKRKIYCCSATGYRNLVIDHYCHVAKTSCSYYAHTLMSTDQEWESKGQIAAAYKIGRMESGAACNLLNNVDADVTERLATMVKKLCLLEVTCFDLI